MLFHLDVESVTGAKVWDLERAFVKLYSRRKSPVDIVIVCGFNQLKMQPVKGIMASFRSLRQTVTDHSIVFRHTVPNSLTISTLMYPPKFSSFKEPLSPTFPKHLTAETNMVKKIDEVNKKIIEFNKEAIVKRQAKHGKDEKDEMSGMHGYGIRFLGKGRREHRWGMWFEEEDARKLHLKHEWRAAVLHRIQLHFINNTEW